MNIKLKVILRLLFFLYFTVYLFSLMFQDKPSPKMYERVIVSVAAPLQSLVHFTQNKISSIFSHYIFLIHAAKENERLKIENGDLGQKLVQLKEVLLENERLRGLLKLEIPSKYTSIQAERIATGSSEFERTLRINKGSIDKVEVGMPVLGEQGVVGQIAAVFPRYSDVLLLTDKSSAIEVIIQRTRSRGILKGFSRHQLAFEFFSIDEDLQVGDVVISSGLDGVYPEGMPVGVVSATGNNGRKLFLTATVDPNVNFSKIEEVRVLVLKERRTF